MPVVDAELLTSPLQLGAAAFVVALSGAMAPGPFLTVTITETLQRGRIPALMLLVGHAVLEGVLLVGFAFGLHTFLQRSMVSTALALAGGGFLLWMGADLLRGAIRGTIRAEAGPTDERRRFGGPILQGIAVSLSNPYWTIWWVTIGVTLAAQGLAMGPVGVVGFFVGHELADIAWYGFVVLAVSSGRKLLTDKVYRSVIGLCAAFLLFLGASFVLSVLR